MKAKYRAPLGFLLVATSLAFIMGQLLGPDHARVNIDDSPADVKRIGMVIGIKPDQIEAYKELHADDHAGVRDLLRRAKMENFSIFMHRLDDGKTYLFGYYE